MNLIGSGSNGKSLYLNMVSNVFGSENITHVPLSELDNEFKRVSFRTALLNISPDDTGTLPRSCRGIFKNIITEDPIDGAKKHKDSLNFRPRVKVMIASEHLPKTNDIGYGMDRRFLFIEFPTTFVRHPKTPNEKELDPNLEEKLKKEIPGIFNFFYEGYKELRKNMTFTETSLEAQLHDRFKKKNNIVLEFLHDVDLTHLNEISNKDAYKKFIEWCYSADYDEVPLSQKSFSRSFRSEFIKLHPDYREYNTSGHRGVKKKEPEQLQMI